MAEILQIADPLADGVIDAYYAELRALAEAALAGDMSQRVFIQRQVQLSLNATRGLFLLAGGEMTGQQAAAWLAEQEQIIRSSAQALARDVFNGRYGELMADGVVTQTAAEGLEKLATRLTLWTYTLGQAYHRGQVYTPAFMPEKMGTWMLGRTEQHCDSCLAQDGQTRSQLEWLTLANQGIEPQGRGLACGGWRCDCRIVWK